MKYILVALALLFAIPSSAQENKQNHTSYYFIRHAEKDRSNPQNRNPNLTEQGHLRAQKWSDVFSNIKFDAVYSTNYNRTLQTAKPTANKNNIEVKLYNPRKLGDAAFIEATKGKTVLVVGHSNTTPAFVNAVIGKAKYKNIDESNNANLYIVTVSKNGDTTDILLVID